MKNSAIIVFLGLLTLPALALGILISPESISQGRCFSVTVADQAREVKLAEAGFLGQKIKFYRQGENMKAIIGVPPEQKPDNQLLAIEVVYQNGEAENELFPIKVKKTNFPTAAFWLKPARKKLLAKDLIAEEWAEIEKVLLQEGEENLREGKFSLPVKGPVSMRFGTIEKVNNQKRGQHRGMDLAVSTGTKVAAPNSGKIVFAKKLKVFGGTMVIDHGQGIHSLYFHLSRLLGEVGQEVGRGEIIAYSGNTGASSGPHLHWGMSAHNLRVDPGQWLYSEL